MRHRDLGPEQEKERVGLPSDSQRVTGPSTSIEKFPSMANLMRWHTYLNGFVQTCGGIILNNRSVLTAAHCVAGDSINQWRIFIGSSFSHPAHNDRQTHPVNRFIIHPLYTSRTLDHNIAILHSAATFTFSNRATPASIAGPNYNVADNQSVWAVGWGGNYGFPCAEPRSLTNMHERRPIPDFLNEVEQVIINQNICRNNYAARNIAITDNMLCSGWHTNGNGHCDEDSGGPLYHNGVVVGVFTFSIGIAQANFPSVHTPVPTNSQRIAGGHNIARYPSVASLLYTPNWSQYTQVCVGTILNNRSILTAAHCIAGGAVYNSNQHIIHPSFNADTLDNDIAILRSATAFSFNNAARAASIAGSNYHLPENRYVWAAGWGVTNQGSSSGSEQLRHVQLETISQNTCRNNYANWGVTITDNVVCAGWNFGGRGQCQGDAGGPLYHNGAVVGVYSFSLGCGEANYPGINTRISSYTSWISSNA
ncbi:unnamed protein product [Spodoptera exigua]|nr:unnamed protein product [Spodoptera exigua]